MDDDLIVAPAAGFDSLASADFADEYHARHGNTGWQALPAPDRRAALRRATQYVLARQVMPRYLDPVHANVQAATAEAALRAAGGALYADIEPQPVVSETVGPVSTSYAPPNNGGRMAFPVIDDLLRGLTAGVWNITVVRA